MFCVVVLGAMRSGTSLVSGLLHEHLGVHMGDVFPPANEMNPTGFYEDFEVSGLHASFLPTDDYSPEAVVLTNDEEKLAAYEAFIRKREALGRPWGFKDRWSPYFFHLAQRYVKQPLKVVATHRPMHASVHSWSKRKQLPLKDARRDIANIIYARDLQLSEFAGPVLHVSYHDLLYNTKAQVCKLANFVDYQGPLEGAIRFVKPELRRFH